MRKFFRYILAFLALMVCAQMAQAQLAGTFTATPLTGTSPLSVSVTWNVPGATSCTASGNSAWTGSKAASGSVTISITTDSTLKLDCTEAATTGTATLSWTAPTTNTDGSAYTDAAGYKIKYGTSASSLTTVISVSSPSTTTYQVTGLSTGTYYFGMTAINASGVESALSNVASIVSSATAAQTFSGSQTIDVTTQPSAPVLTVTSAAVYDVVVDRDLYALVKGRQIGMVKIGSLCDASRCLDGSACKVADSSLQTIYKKSSNGMAVAQCG